MSWSQASTTTGFYSGMNYSVSELGGFAGSALAELTGRADIGRQKIKEEKRKAQEAAERNGAKNSSSAGEGFVNALGAGLIRIKNDLEKLWNGLTGDGFNTNDELKQMEEGKKQAIAAALGEWDKMKTEDMSQDILSNFNADTREVTDAKIQAMRDAKLDTTQIEKQVAVLRQQDAAYKAQLKADSLAQQSAGKETYGYGHDTPINKWAGEALYSPEESNTGILKSIKGVFFDIVNAQANEWEAGVNKMTTPDVKDDLSKYGYTKGKDPWLDNMHNAYPDEVGSVIKADYNDKLIQNMLGPVAYKDYQKGGGAGFGLGLMDGINPAVYVKDLLSAGFNSESTREARLQDVSNESIAYQMGFNKGYDSGSGMISSALLLTSFATMNPTAAAKSAAAQDVDDFARLSNINRPEDLGKVYHSTTRPFVADDIISNGINPEKFNPYSRFGEGFYVADSELTTIKELEYHNSIKVDTIEFTLDNVKLMDSTGSISNIGVKYSPKLLAGYSKMMGYDGIYYNSLRNTGGHNIVLFKNFESLKNGKIKK